MACCVAGPVIHETLSTPALMEAVSAKRLVLRTRMYEDEVDRCRDEVGQQKTKQHGFQDNIHSCNNDVEWRKRSNAIYGKGNLMIFFETCCIYSCVTFNTAKVTTLAR